MNETKVLAAILTIAASAREPRNSSQEIGKEHWNKVIKVYDQILAALEQKQKQ